MKIHKIKSWVNHTLSTYFHHDSAITYCLRVVEGKNTDAFARRATCKQCIKFAKKDSQ